MERVFSLNRCVLPISEQKVTPVKTESLYPGIEMQHPLYISRLALQKSYSFWTILTAKWWLSGRAEGRGAYWIKPRGNVLWETCSCPTVVAVHPTGWWETEKFMKFGTFLLFERLNVAIRNPPRSGAVCLGALCWYEDAQHGVRSQKWGSCSWMDMPNLGQNWWFGLLDFFFFFLDKLTSATCKSNSELEACTLFLRVQSKMTISLRTIQLASGWTFLPPGTNAFPWGRNCAMFFGAL